MRFIIGVAVGLIFVFATVATAQVWVDPYVNNNGTYVPGHMQSSPNNTRLDNWSTRGNVNPYTGQMGHSNPYPNSYPQYNPNRGYQYYDPNRRY